MNTDKLVRMANQIATFFEAYPEEEAVAGVREHIVAFWAPRMVEGLRLRAERDTAGLLPLAARAILAPAPATESPADKAASGPGELGQLASDAG